jgi:MFS family permease
MAGAMAGFFFSGTLIDRFGTRPVFVICHLGLAISILTLLTRGVLGFDYVVTVGGCILFFGLFMASSSVAITTEMMFLFPPRNKAISSALTTSMVTAGQAFSGLLAAGLIQLGALHGEWRFLNATLSQYDTLLLLCGSGVLVCTVTLGLIPSVLRKKSDWSQINANLT